MPSLSSIRKVLKKELGFTFRKIRPLESYVNRLPNKILRQHAGIKMIELVSNGYVLLNMDQHNLVSSDNRLKSWFPKG